MINPQPTQLPIENDKYYCIKYNNGDEDWFCSCWFEEQNANVGDFISFTMDAKYLFFQELKFMYTPDRIGFLESTHQLLETMTEHEYENMTNSPKETEKKTQETFSKTISPTNILDVT